MSVNRDGLLRIRELAETSGVPAPTIKHYLREGLLPEPVKTSRNMAYYPPEFVDRIKLIKRLQEERYLPLKAIKDVLEARERPRTSGAEVRRLYGVPKEVLDRLAELEVLTPNSCGYSPSDARSSRRSAASAPAATTSRSASPSTTLSATKTRWKSWSGSRSTW
jgi:DNA-binding transcriptional MerR regulator